MGKISLKISPDTLTTFVAEFLVLISGLIVYKLAAAKFGQEGFSEYSLCRRTVSFIQPIMMLGLGVGLVRYIAINYSRPAESDKYFIGGSFVLFVFSTFIILVLLLFRHNFAFLFFGNERYYYFMMPICMMLFGLMLHSISYSYLRGKLKITFANILQVINMCIVPLAVFYWSDSLIHLLYFNGLLWVSVSFLSFIYIFRFVKFDKHHHYKPELKEMMRYSIPRVPGDIGYAAYFIFPAIITTHVVGIKEAGFVAFGITILNMVTGFFSPISLILLPKTSYWIANKEFNLLEDNVKKISLIAVLLTIAGTLFFFAFGDKIIELYLGPNYEELIKNTKLILFGSIFFALFICLRSVIDAYFVTARNSKNILISLVVFLGLSTLLFIFPINYFYINIFFVIGLFVLCVLTVLDILIVFRNK
ncbi:MAG: oligosaccharide flippase family protein [Bacteroidota bacterium]